jgi:hypothetical protein
MNYGFPSLKTRIHSFYRDQIEIDGSHSSTGDCSLVLKELQFLTSTCVFVSKMLVSKMSYLFLVSCPNLLKIIHHEVCKVEKKNGFNSQRCKRKKKVGKAGRF